MARRNMRPWLACALVVIAIDATAFAAGSEAPSKPVPDTAASASASPTPSEEDRVERAREHFRRGVALYHDGDYQAASIAFRRAQEIAPSYKVLYNLGQAELELRNYAAALAAFQAFVQEGGKSIPPDTFEEVTDQIERLAGLVAEVRVRAKPEGALVTVDGVDAGIAPLSEPITVSVGRRRIVVSKSGFIPASRTVDLAGGESVDLDFELSAARPTALPPQKPQPAPSPRTKLDTRFWVGAATTGMLATAAAVTGVIASKAERENEDLRQTPGASRSEVQASADRARDFALATDILVGTAAAAAGVTLYFAIGSGDSSRVGLGPGSIFVAGTL